MKDKNIRILVFSHQQFDNVCEAHGWDDSNVESLEDMAFISIIGTDECRKFYMNDERDHWFRENHNNVLNLEFDDLFSDKMYKGHLFKAMNEEQARLSVDFIENNIGKTFFIHCHAGISRSQAFFRFITDFFPNIYSKDCGRKDNMCVNPNLAVFSSLRRAFYEKHNVFTNNNWE